MTSSYEAEPLIADGTSAYISNLTGSSNSPVRSSKIQRSRASQMLAVAKPLLLLRASFTDLVC